MDEFTKMKVKRAMLENPDLPVRVIIAAIRDGQRRESEPYIRRK